LTKAETGKTWFRWIPGGGLFLDEKGPARSQRRAEHSCFCCRANPFRVLLWLAAFALCSHAAFAANSGWHNANEEELRALIPARAPVISERIETEFRTASGITDGKGHFIAGVVLITAGYSADGKYSHYFVSQVPLKVADFLLPPGQYLIGWVRGQDSLKVTFYLAQSGKPVGQVEAARNLSITRVESFRIWPPGDKALIQLGRFTFSYTLAP
jgi:hypothetical protein